MGGGLFQGSLRLLALWGEVGVLPPGLPSSLDFRVPLYPSPLPSSSSRALSPLPPFPPVQLFLQLPFPSLSLPDLS